MSKTKKAPEPILVKVKPQSSFTLTCYQVSVKGGSVVGYVWKERGFSYRGTQGWNRGVRLKDFHPMEWHYGKKLGIKESGSYGQISRKFAINSLLGL